MTERKKTLNNILTVQKHKVQSWKMICYLIWITLNAAIGFQQFWVSSSTVPSGAFMPSVPTFSLVSLLLWSSDPTDPLVLCTHWSSVSTGPLVLCFHCSSVPTGPLVLCAHWSSVPTGPLYPLVFCSHCSSGPLYSLVRCAHCSLILCTHSLYPSAISIS